MPECPHGEEFGWLGSCTKCVPTAESRRIDKLCAEVKQLRAAAIVLWSVLYTARLNDERRQALEMTKWVLDENAPVPL